PSPEGLGGELTPEDRARIDADELRVFETHTPNFSFHCQEVLAHGAAPGAAAVVRFLPRRSGTSREAFLERLNGRHADIAIAAAEAAGSVTRYVHDALREEPPPGYPFDAIVETWFAAPEDAVRSLGDPGFAAVRQDLETFCDPDRSVALLTH